MSTQDLVEKFIQEKRNEGRIEGRNEGRIEGRNEGRLEGRHEAVREAVLDLFTERFGAAPPDVAAIVAGTEDLAVLRGWLKLVAWAPSEEVLASIRSQRAR